MFPGRLIYCTYFMSLSYSLPQLVHELMFALHHDSHFQCLHQKIEVEKNLATSTSQEVASTGSDVLVKHLQQELRHYVSLLSFLS